MKRFAGQCHALLLASMSPMRGLPPETARSSTGTFLPQTWGSPEWKRSMELRSTGFPRLDKSAHAIAPRNDTFRGACIPNKLDGSHVVQAASKQARRA